MSDCVTVSDATILYCSDIECTENTCYAAHDHSNQQQLDSTITSPTDEQHSDYAVPRVT